MSDSEAFADNFPCPNCGYDLQGLPVRHTCPECGMACDPHMIIIKLRGPRERYIAPFIGHPTDALIVVLVVLWVVNLRFQLVGNQYACGTILTLVGIFVLARFYLFVTRHHRPRRLILNHRGVHIDHPGLDPMLIAWSQIAEARYRWWSGSFFIRARQRRSTLFKCSRLQLGSARIARRCAREINRLAAVYQPQP